MLKTLLNDERLIATSETMQETYGTLPAFDHLVRVNWANSQAFFLKGFSHVFNNQINSIQLGGELLQNFAQDIERLFDMFESEPENLPFISCESRDRLLVTMPKVIHGISTSARRLSRFASHLSELTGSGNIAASRDVNLNQLASLCVSMTDHKIHTFTDHFQLNLEADIPTLTGNAQQMLQVILNLLMNALLSLPDRSCEVVLSTSCNRDAGQVQLCIRDAGTGISPDILPRIGERFFTTWSKHGCMGLGLTVADRIIRCHGGELLIDSAPGKGTSAIISLPIPERIAACKTECNHG